MSFFNYIAFAKTLIKSTHMKKATDVEIKYVINTKYPFFIIKIFSKCTLFLYRHFGLFFKEDY